MHEYFHEFMLDWWEGAHFGGVLRCIYNIYKLFLKKKSAKRSLSYIHHELFTIRIVSMEGGGVE